MLVICDASSSGSPMIETQNCLVSRMFKAESGLISSPCSDRSHIPLSRR